MKKLKLWHRRRKFNKAYMILREEADRHKAAGHNMSFHAANESFVEMICTHCPDLQP